MTYRGRVQNGVVVFEGDERPQEGLDVDVELAKPSVPRSMPKAKGRKKRQRSTAGTTVGQRLLKFSGMIKDDKLPKDGAAQHDHYLYGSPKRK